MNNTTDEIFDNNTKEDDSIVYISNAEIEYTEDSYNEGEIRIIEIAGVPELNGVYSSINKFYEKLNDSYYGFSEHNKQYAYIEDGKLYIDSLVDDSYTEVTEGDDAFKEYKEGKRNLINAMFMCDIQKVEFSKYTDDDRKKELK